jgi:peroxiredoxin
MLPLGTTAPDFKLPDTSGKIVSLADFKDAPALLVIFMCNHCPYVVHIRAGLAQLAHDYAPKHVAIVGINSNDAANYPADSPAKMKDEVKSAGYIFPYLHDETQAVAKAYRAACTPDIYFFDRGRRLVYRGQFDASRPGNGIPVTGKDLRAALDAVLAGRPTSELQAASMGCNIKWKTGNEPDYFCLFLRQLGVHHFAQNVVKQFLRFLDSRCVAAGYQQINGRHVLREAAVASQETNAFDSPAFCLFQCAQDIF